MALDSLEQMLSDVQAGKAVAFARGYEDARWERQVVCHFDFEPRIRHIPLIEGFNRILNIYTSFSFEPVFVRRSCIEVGFYAKDFSLDEKNLVRRQIMYLLKAERVAAEFKILQITIFGRIKFSEQIGFEAA